MISKISEEFLDISFGDKRLDCRFKKIADQLSSNMGASIPLACEDWANTKAAYRFFKNKKITLDKILDPHKFSTHERIKKNDDEFTLILHDTTELTYTNHPSIKDLNPGRRLKLRNPKKDGSKTIHYDYNLIMHTSLALTTNGVPLGVTALKIWDRDKFKDTTSMKRKVNPTRVPIESKESYKWIENIDKSSSEASISSKKLVHIGDRDSDMFELFELCDKTDTNFVIRVAHNRNVGFNGELLYDAGNNEIIQSGTFNLEVRDSNKVKRNAKINLSYSKVNIIPTMSKRKNFAPIALYYIVAEEVLGKDENPSNPIIWRLLTNLPIKSLKSAHEKIYWYSLRWKIEVYFKVLKTGCKVEDCRLQTKQGLMRYLTLMSIVSWRIFWITMFSRENPTGSPEECLTKEEIRILKKIAQKKNTSWNGKTLQDYYYELAKLGGFLARKCDGEPGFITTWRGYLRLQDILLGFRLI